MHTSRRSTIEFLDDEQCNHVAQLTYRRKVWFLRTLKLLIVMIVVWGIYRAVDRTWSDLKDHEFTLSLPWAVLAGVLYVLGLLPSGCFWYLSLRVMGQRPKLSDALTAYFVGHLGKYAPGKAMVVVLRTTLIRGQGVSTSVAAVSAVLETLTMMTSGAFLAAVTILFGFREHAGLVATASGLLLLSAVPTLPPVFRWLVALPRGRMITHEDIAALKRVNFRLIAVGWLATGLGWMLLAGSLWATLQALGAPHAELLSHFPLYLASVTLAVVAGFLSLIPGGAGVRELVLDLLLARSFTPSLALLSALFLRLIWLTAEIIVSGGCYAVRLWRRKGESRNG